MLWFLIVLTLAIVDYLNPPPDGFLEANPGVIALLGAGALAKGIGGSKSRTATQDSTTDQTQEGVRGPRQQRVFKQLGNALLDALNQGPTVSQSDRNAGRTNINNTWLGLGKNLESNLTARGFGESGKLGGQFKGLEIGRANAFQGLEAQLRNEAQSRFERMLGLSQQFVQPTTFHTTGTSSGSSTQPGQPFLSGFGSGIGDIGSLLLLKSLLGGANAPGSSPLSNDAASQLGSGGFPCYVAVVLYGVHDSRIPTLRRWLAQHPRLKAVYNRYGYRVAQFAIRHKSARLPLRVIFDSLMMAAEA